MKSRLILVGALSFTLAACQTPDAGKAPVNTTGASVTGASNAASMPLSTPKAWADPTKASVWELAVTTHPKAGGPTLADVNTDDDPNDAFEPVVDVSVKADGWAATGTIQARGHSTRHSDQKSYNIKLAKDAQPWNGYTSLQLNKHPYDLTRMRNKLAFDLLGYVPELAACTTQFVHVTADGKDMGLFTMVQKVDKDFLKAHGLDAAGSLYKAENFEFSRYPDKLKLTTDAGYDKKAFESVLEIEGSKDHQPLLGMLDAVNDENVPTDQVMARYFDRENFVTWLALNILMGNQDTASQNYFLYRPTNGSWYFLPWDYDGAWGFYDEPDQKDVKGTMGRWQEGLPNWWASRWIRRYLQLPGASAELDARVHELASTLLTRAHIQALTASYQDVVKGYVTKDPDGDQLPVVGHDKAGEWAAEVARLAGVVDTNIAAYDRTKNRPMPYYLGDPAQEGATVRFNWDASVSLAGHALSYDLEVSTSPDFAATVAKKPGLTEPTTSVESLAPGTYYVRVTARDTADPTQLWQLAFDQLDANGRHYDGVKAFTVK